MKPSTIVAALLRFSTPVSVLDMSLPAGYSPPAYANTHEDRAGWAVVASGVGLVFIILFASIRLYTRYPFRSRLLYDDLAIIVSTAFAIIQSSLVIGAASHGLGKAASIIQPGMQLPTEKVTNSTEASRLPQERLTVCSDALRERSILSPVDFLLPNRCPVSSLRLKSRALAQARLENRYISEHTHGSRCNLHDRLRL